MVFLVFESALYIPGGVVLIPVLEFQNNPLGGFR
jgi:hypothetical protein